MIILKGHYLKFTLEKKSASPSLLNIIFLFFACFIDSFRCLGANATLEFGKWHQQPLSWEEIGPVFSIKITKQAKQQKTIKLMMHLLSEVFKQCEC